MKHSILILSALIICGSSLISCDKTANGNPPAVETGFAKGADISWITEMESAGRKFYDFNGKETECFALMKQLGMNAVRLRVWVNPSAHGNWCNTADLLVKAKRAQALGLRIMIDFHYSDWWADPGQQYKPAAWKNLSFEELKNALAQHTTDVLSALKAENITPEWVQAGNENRSGMLWDTNVAVSGATYDVQQDGITYAKNEANFAAFIKTGYDAVKSVFPDAKVIVHIDNGYDNATYRWIFDMLKRYGAKWDVIGMSLYPKYAVEAHPEKYASWQTVNDDCITNVKDMIARYNTEVMICEVGMEWNKAEECKSFLSDLIAKARAVPNDKCLGVFYWEPEAYNWVSYQLGAFDTSGKPTTAMEAFKK